MGFKKKVNGTHNWGGTKQNPWVGVSKLHLLLVPFCPFKVQAIDVDTIGRFRCFVVNLIDIDVLKVKRNLVDVDFMLPRVILECASEEGMGEENTRQPAHDRLALFNPLVEEIQAFQEILNVATQRFS